jgi:dipeptidase D
MRGAGAARRPPLDCHVVAERHRGEVSGLLAGLEPAAFWRHFEALTRIPRPSRHEEKVVAHVREWAGGQGFEVAADAAGNLVVRVPATSAREGAPTIVLQGHLDMVCERDPGSPNDPAEGRIELVREGDWLEARGTTLGADDGVAIAAMMALADDDSLHHGPLELLMTVAEEVGLEGVNALDPGLVSGSVLLNLDSEEDGHLTVGCAGSTDVWVRLHEERTPVTPGSRTLVVSVAGGLGGHSGADIAAGRANAIKVLGRVLRDAHEAAPFGLVSLEGGNSRNAIPRAAHAVCSVAREDEDAFRRSVAETSTAVTHAYAVSDPGVVVTAEESAEAYDAWSRDATARLLDVVALLPSGPLTLSPAFPGVVETSSSIGVATTDGETLVLHSLCRSSNDPALPAVIGAIGAAARLAGGTIDVKRNHGGWRPDLESPLLALARRVYVRLFGGQPALTIAHFGIEPAVIGLKRPDLDMISFGPQIEFPHSPGERLGISTVDRFWRLLAAVLDELS